MPRVGLGQRIRCLRKENRLTQEQLARQICTTKNNISRYEREYSSPSYEALRLLAIELHTTVDYLVGVPGASMSAYANSSSLQDKILSVIADFSEQEVEKLLDYAELLKKARE